jgi:hypothetical protein
VIHPPWNGPLLIIHLGICHGYCPCPVQKVASAEDDIQHKVSAVELTRQAADCKAGKRLLNQMVFRNTTHIGSGFVFCTQTATTPALRLVVED